jgi:hypothetical protein
MENYIVVPRASAFGREAYARRVAEPERQIFAIRRRLGKRGRQRRHAKIKSIEIRTKRVKYLPLRHKSAAFTAAGI